MLRALALLSLLAALVGGWAVITVEALPEYVVAGQAVPLTFTVRQHGKTRLSGLSPRIEARSGDVATAVQATPGRDEGAYAAVLTLPRPGEWTITIHSGFHTSQLTLLPVPAVPAGTAAPSPLPPSERGRQLFVAKGCVTCHVHRDVPGSGTVAVGPELPSRRWSPDYVMQFLANPAIAPRTGAAQMPNLDLKPPEIAALAAFVAMERQALR